MAYDSLRRRTLLYGGDGVAASDTWEWDGHSWHSIRFAGPTPGARHGHVLVFDERTESTALFGGFQRPPGESTSTEGLGTWILPPRAEGAALRVEVRWPDLGASRPTALRVRAHNLASEGLAFDVWDPRSARWSPTQQTSRR